MWREAMEISPAFSVEHLMGLLPYADPGPLERFAEGLRRAGLMPLHRWVPLSSTRTQNDRPHHPDLSTKVNHAQAGSVLLIGESQIGVHHLGIAQK